MAASTPMNDDWEIVFIDEDGEVVSGKAPVAQSKDENPWIDSAPVPQSKPEVPIETYILPKELQLVEKEQKESTEREPARPIPVRQTDRPVPDCYRPTYAFNGNRLSYRDFHKQYAQVPAYWSFFQSEPWKVDESATKTDSKEISKVDQELAQYSKESKARTTEQLKDRLLFPRQQGSSAEITGPSRPDCDWKRACVLPLPPLFGMEQGEMSRSGAERNNAACPEFMMPQVPSLTPAMLERMQAMKNMSHSDGSISLGSAASSSLERKVSLRHDSAVIVFLLEGRSHFNGMEKAKAKLEKTFSGWNVTFDYRSSFSSEDQMEILRRHSLCVKEMEFVRIGFISRDDRGRALGVLDSEIRNSRGPRMAARAWLY